MNVTDLIDLAKECKTHSDYEAYAKYVGVDYDTYYESMLGIEEDVPDEDLAHFSWYGIDWALYYGSREATMAYVRHNPTPNSQQLHNPRYLIYLQVWE